MVLPASGRAGVGVEMGIGGRKVAGCLLSCSFPLCRGEMVSYAWHFSRTGLCWFCSKPFHVEVLIPTFPKLKWLQNSHHCNLLDTPSGSFWAGWFLGMVLEGLFLHYTVVGFAQKSLLFPKLFLLTMVWITAQTWAL